MKFLKLSLIIVCISFSDLIAQPPPPGGQPGNPPAPVPLSGIEYLVVAGGILGFRKIRNRLKNI